MLRASNFTCYTTLMDFSSLPDISISLSAALWVALGLAVLVWITLTSIVLYHWHNYANSDKRVRRMKITYIALSLLLFVSAASFIVSL